MKKVRNILTALAVTGNLLFMLWITYNGVHERFSGTLWEKLSYVGLMALLLINTFLLISSDKAKSHHDKL
jgi:hypothetical protein